MSLFNPTAQQATKTLGRLASSGFYCRRNHWMKALGPLATSCFEQGEPQATKALGPLTVAERHILPPLTAHFVHRSHRGLPSVALAPLG